MSPQGAHGLDRDQSYRFQNAKLIVDTAVQRFDRGDVDDTNITGGCGAVGDHLDGGPWRRVDMGSIDQYIPRSVMSWPGGGFDDTEWEWEMEVNRLAIKNGLHMHIWHNHEPFRAYPVRNLSFLAPDIGRRRSNRRCTCTTPNQKRRSTRR
jgi:hypothetical protein